MSSGLMSIARFEKSTPRLLNAVAEPGASEASTLVFIVLLSIGSPSMMKSGWLLLLMELVPRIVIDDEAPGTPEVLFTVTPATRPCRALTKFVRCDCAISAPRTVCCAVPTERSAAVCPRAVVTTSSSFVTDFRSWTSTTVAWPTVRCSGA